MTIPLKQYGELLSRYLKPQGLRVALLAAVLLGSIGLQLLNPQITRYFIDTALAGGALEALTFAALAFLGIALFNQALSVLATYLGENVGWAATNMLRVIADSPSGQQRITMRPDGPDRLVGMGDSSFAWGPSGPIELTRVR